MVRSEDEHELNDAPLLRGVPKHDPFIAPDGFFDELPHRVQQRIVSQQANRSTVLTALWSMPRPVWSGLAILVLIAVTWVLWPTPGTQESPVYTYTPGPEDMIDLGADEELLYAVAGTGQPLLDARRLPLDEGELAAYIEYEEVSLDLLIEEL